MLELFFAYLEFLLKTITVTVAIAFIIGLVVRWRSEKSPIKKPSDIRLKNYNSKLLVTQAQLNRELMNAKEYKNYVQDLTKQEKKRSKKSDEQPRLYVLDFLGDTKASAVSELREQITVILTLVREHDEVMLRLESPGGIPIGYGLAASQLERLHQASIHLTVCVDKIAASGGYMMACIANNIVAAPFAFVGSIGVVGIVPNVSKLLERFDVNVEQHTAGEYKRTLDMFSENTIAGRVKYKEQLNAIHTQFKELVLRYRPNIDITCLESGEYWQAADKGIERGLVDELGTSDQFLLSRRDTHQIYEVSSISKKSLVDHVRQSTSRLVRKFLTDVETN